MRGQPPRATLVPYTTLVRSRCDIGGEAPEGVRTKRGAACVSHRRGHRGGVDRAWGQRAAGGEGGKGARRIGGYRCRDRAGEGRVGEAGVAPGGTGHLKRKEGIARGAGR